MCQSTLSRREDYSVREPYSEEYHANLPERTYRQPQGRSVLDILMEFTFRSGLHLGDVRWCFPRGGHLEGGLHGELNSPVGNPELFTGRKQEIERLLTWIEATHDVLCINNLLIRKN